MRITLVHPSGSNWIPGKKDVTVAANRLAPIGLLSIASFLEKAGHQVSVHDCLGPKAPRGTTANARQISETNPELIGFSTTTSAFLDACDLARKIKQVQPEVTTLCGGVHVSAMGGTLLERFPEIDCLCLGEGEQTTAELAAGRPPGEIDGLVWRDGDQVLVNPDRKVLPQLDSLPFPAYEKLARFPRGYHLPPFSYVNSPGATMSTSRGCVYQCSYCDRSVFGRSFRFNSADYVFEHILFLKNRFGVRHINIYDDLFTTQRKRVIALCERLARERLGVQFGCAVRVGHADDDLLSILKEAGFLAVSVGIESGDPRLLEQHKSGVTLEQIRDTVTRIQAAGLRAKGLFMIGLPGEDEESIKKTSDFVISLNLDDMNTSKFTPFPGAPCWSTIRKQGSFDEDWRKMNCLNFVFIPRGISSRERLDMLYNKHVQRFYRDPAWKKKFFTRLWSHRRSLWQMAINLPSFLEARRHFKVTGD